MEDEGDEIITNIDLDEILKEINGNDEPAIILKAKEDSIDFQFPFEPYSIQKDFMTALYRTLHEKKMGIFESPTGTGKSLSIICGALKWLKDEQKREKEHLTELRQTDLFHTDEDEQKDGELDWVVQFSKKRRLERVVKPEIELLEKKQTMLTKVEELKNRRGLKTRHDLQASFSKLYGNAINSKSPVNESGLFMSEEDSEFQEHEDVIAALKACEDDKEENNKLPRDDVQHVTKIFFSSRTHSQLSQFLKEVKRSPYGADTSVLCFGSRGGLCVNEAVRRLGSNYLINERCLEMSAKGKAKKGSCQFKARSGMDSLADEFLTEILDIEDMYKQGRSMKACPYYSVRAALPWAELVLLPYQILLHKETRDSCLGPNALRGNVVIVDEAHNLLDTIVATHSAVLQYERLVAAINQLNHYMKKHKSRFHPNNWLRLTQISYTINNWCEFIEKVYIKSMKGRDTKTVSNQEASSITNMNSFLYETQTESINFYPLVSYLRSSGLVRKLSGLPTTKVVETTKRETQKLQLKSFLNSVKIGSEENIPPDCSKVDEQKASYLSSMTDVQSFFVSITEDNGDGRLFVKTSSELNKCSLNFMPLNPANHFHDIVHEARSVIVAGGTMQPVSEFSDQLFGAAGCDNNQITKFSCGHVILDKQLILVALSSGVTDSPFIFTFSQRSKPEMLNECGETIKEIAKLISGGMVIFFQSYDYLSKAYDHWETSGLLKQIQSFKRVFRESKQSSSVESVLSSFNDAISSHSNGAILLCVVGGKMSEGINFSDDLGRCVIVIGLPYANPKDPILVEKMRYLDNSCGAGSGQTYYQGLCMKAVNQSIGRAIRHRNDYAAVFLFDQRYHSPNIVEQLPAWMRPSLRLDSSFANSRCAVVKFMKEMKSH